MSSTRPLHALENGAEPGGGPPSRLDQHVKSEIAKWGRVVKAAHVTIE